VRSARTVRSQNRLSWLLLPGLLAFGACALSSGAAGTPEGDVATARLGELPGAPDHRAIYRDMELLVSEGEVQFVGRIGFLAGPSPDSTTVVLSISLPASAVTFVRSDQRRLEGGYTVHGEFVSDGRPSYRFSSEETVVVSSYRETNRSDARLLFQESFRLAPGSHSLTLSVGDASSTRAGLVASEVQVPRFGGGGVSSALPLLQGDGRTDRSMSPGIVADPLGTYTFGRDSAVRLYVERYSAGREFLLQVFLEDGTLLRSDTVAMEPGVSGGEFSSGRLRIPLSRVGIGVSEIQLTALGERPAVSPRLPVFVSFGPDIPLASFDDLVSYLRWFTSASRLEALSSATPEQRPEAWRSLLAATDPDPGTPEHEGLREYFQRVMVANIRFRGEAAQGWLSDRGRVFVALGEPDVVIDNTSNLPTQLQRGRRIAWEYRRFNVRLVFQDDTGYDGWRLLPGQEEQLHAALVQLHGS
jgi:GWxTD domain-containing protein